MRRRKFQRTGKGFKKRKSRGKTGKEKKKTQSKRYRRKGGKNKEKKRNGWKVGFWNVNWKTKRENFG